MNLRDLKYIIAVAELKSFVKAAQQYFVSQPMLSIHAEYLHAEPLFDDTFKLAVSTQHPLAKSKTICPNDLINEPLLLLDEGHRLRDQALQFCQLNSFIY